MIAAKGPNIMGIEERCALVRACKWVDEVLNKKSIFIN